MKARKEFIEDQPNFVVGNLIFLDESGIDVAMSRAYGWALKGETPVIECPAKGRRINLIGAISVDGVKALRQVDGSVNGEVFKKFIIEDLCPTLKKGDIVIMDGLSVHKVNSNGAQLDGFLTYKT